VNESNASHAPLSAHPDDTVTLGKGARVRDRTSGASETIEEWLSSCSEREGRPVDECRDDLMNAIARGDVRVEDAGIGA
jgi:hypothetical protein